MRFVECDGGRAAAGFKGSARDCVTRAVAIAAETPYTQVYESLALGNEGERKSKRAGWHSGRRSARNGISVGRKWFRDYMTGHGFRWVPTMAIGQGCSVHLKNGELPGGRLVVRLSRHVCAMIDGVIYDASDPQRATHCQETVGDVVRHWVSGRCVYGYWKLEW